jgi:hypothetical protein
MNMVRHMVALALSVAVLAVFSACDRQDTASEPAKPAPEPTKPAQPAATPTEPAPKPAKPTPVKPTPAPTAAPEKKGETAAPAPAGTQAKATSTGAQLVLTGLTMTAPQDWVAEPAKPGSSTIAVYRLPKAEADTGGCFVRITHFPNMKGMDEMNINRWLTQLKRPDGQPLTREDAKIEVQEMGPVRLTTVDLTGTVLGAKDGKGGRSPDYRMIAAIVDHPEGPHFVKATGGIASMKQAEGAILAFLKSAKVN